MQLLHAKITSIALGCLLFPQKLHTFFLPCASFIWLIGSDSRHIYFRLLQIHKSIKKHGENWNRHTHFLEWCWTEIHVESHANFLMRKHEGSPKLRTLQIQIIVHVCSTPRRWKRSHSWLHKRALFCCKELPLTGSRPVHRKRNTSKI